MESTEKAEYLEKKPSVIGREPMGVLLVSQLSGNMLKF